MEDIRNPKALIKEGKLQDIRKMRTTEIIWYVTKRHKFGLVSLYAVAFTMAVAVANFNSAWQSFVR